MIFTFVLQCLIGCKMTVNIFGFILLLAALTPGKTIGKSIHASSSNEINHPKVFYGRPRDLPAGRIVGGHDADINDYPYQISLQFYSKHGCGGSIISDKYIITAAHCTYNTSKNIMSVRVKTSLKEKGGVVFKIKKIFEHPKYTDNKRFDYDFAILELEKPLQMGPGVQPIGLPDQDEVLPEGTLVSISGWGDLFEGSRQGSKQLQVVETGIVPNEKCLKYYNKVKEHYGQITDRMICAGEPEVGGKDSCQNDSGGPLVTNGTLYGVVSWGNGCGKKGFPGVYANVANLRQYVKDITGL